MADSVDGNSQEIVVDVGVNEEVSSALLNDDPLTLVASSSNGDFYFIQERPYVFHPDSLLDSLAYQFVTVMNRDGEVLDNFKIHVFEESRGQFSVLKGYDNTLYVHELKATAHIKDEYNQEWYLRSWSQIGQYDENRLLATYKSGVQSILIENKEPSGWGFPKIVPLSAPIVHGKFEVDEQGNVYALGTTILQQSSLYVEKLAAK